MTFPVWIPVGPWRLHPHLVFEVLAYATGFLLYLDMRRRRGDRVDDSSRWSLVAGVLIGAAIGSRALAWLEDPAALLRGSSASLAGKTIVGGLLGAWLVTEIQKRRLGIRESTGDLYVFPLVVAIAIGRIGCLLSGLSDQTYGIATSLPWGVDFGDGILRHPTALYESLFVVALGFVLIRVQGRLVLGDLFKIFMASYLAFRLLADAIKPGVAVGLGLTSIQWACVVGLVYYTWWFIREGRDRWHQEDRRPDKVARSF